MLFLTTFSLYAIASSLAIFQLGEYSSVFFCILQYTKSNVCNISEENMEELAEHYEGCRCQSDRCFPAAAGSCSCIDRFGPSYDTNSYLLDVVPYTDLLRPVLECNDDCLCGHSCSNRVVQHGVTVKLQVFDVGNKGVGVRTLQPIARGRFVCEYSGELLSYGSARSRSAYTNLATHNYILEVREFFGAKSLATYVDATYAGNVGRFINHSCDPNLFVQPVRVENAIPRVALFSLRDIPIYTELTYDYAGGVNMMAEYDFSCTPGSCESKMPRKPCLCGFSHCRLFLPYDNALLMS